MTSTNRITGIAIKLPALHQPVGLPLVTNGPDNANDNNDRTLGGRSRGPQPA